MTTKKKKTTKTGDQAKVKVKKAPAKTAQKSKTTDDDGRNDQRIPIQLLVDYRADGHYLFDFCKDLGVGGVFIQTHQPLPQGSSVDLTFTIPDSKETLQTSGRVIWVQDRGAKKDDASAGMGVQFEKFSAEQRKILEDFLNRFNANGGNLNNATQRSA